MSALRSERRSPFEIPALILEILWAGGERQTQRSTTVAFLARGSDLLPDGWERMDERRVDRGNLGAVGGIVAGSEGADAPVVHAGTGSGLGGSVSGWAAGAGAAQDRPAAADPS